MPSAADRSMNAETLSEYEYDAGANVALRMDEPVIVVGGAIVPADGTAATGAVFGFSKFAVNNLGGAAGDKRVVVVFGKARNCVYIPLASVGAPTQAHIGTAVSLDATSSLISGLAGNRVGTLIALDPAMGGMVEI